MNDYAVLVTSAVNTKFGVYKNDVRLAQTIATIKSVKQQIPNATIFVLEMAGVPLTTEQQDALTAESDHLLNFTADEDVVNLYNSNDNWDIVKNVTEVLCFSKALKTLNSTGQLSQYKRIFKISGRYLLTDDFNLPFYTEYKTQSMIVLGSKKDSQFPFKITETEFQYMSRLWSWPPILTEEIIEAYDNSLKYMSQRLAAGGYVDIEHCLYKFIDSAKIVEKSPLGLIGNIAPNGVAIKD